MADKISEVNKLFAHEWMINGNFASRAYKVAYPNAADNTAMTHGPNVLNRPEVQAYIKTLLDKRLKQYEVTETRIIEELASLAFLDIKDLLNKDGSLKDIDQIPKRARAAIAGVEIESIRAGQEEVGSIKKIKLSSKEKSLETLAKYKKLLTDKHEITGDGDLARALGLARKRTTTTETTIEELLE